TTLVTAGRFTFDRDQLSPGEHAGSTTAGRRRKAGTNGGRHGNGLGGLGRVFLRRRILVQRDPAFRRRRQWAPVPEPFRKAAGRGIVVLDGERALGFHQPRGGLFPRAVGRD